MSVLERTQQWVCATWDRIRNADLVDWLFALLFLTVGIAVAAGTVAVLNEEPTPWGGVSYVNPVNVTDVSADTITVEVTRIVDCASFTCPNGSLPIEFATVFTMPPSDGGVVAVAPVVSGATVFVEGTDYTVGKLRAATITYEVDVPAEVAAGGTWRLDTVVTATVPNAIPAVIYSDPLDFDDVGE